MTHDITKDQLVKVLPKHLALNVNDSLVDTINNTITDPFMREAYRDNLISYTGVLKEGRFTVESYLDAVRYISFKLRGDKNQIAYVKTFPDRYQNMLDMGHDAKEINRNVSAYNKNKLVNLIFEQSMIPTHVMNADIYQDAINVQANLMNDPDVSAKVRTDAANSLLTHLKKPETKLELDITVKEDSSIKELNDATRALVAQQREMLMKGVTTATQVAHSKLIIEGEAEIVDI